jgi:hypothetical protein
MTMTSKTVEERMESVEAQGQAVARQMAQITNLLENALHIQPILEDDERHLTVTTPEAEPLELGASLEDQYVAVNYTSVRFPGWEHGGTRPVQIHTLDDPFHRSSRE